MTRRSAFWPCFWLGIALFLAKAVHWSVPGLDRRRIGEYAVDLAVSSHADLLFATGVFVVFELLLRASGRRPGANRAVWISLLCLGVVCVVYAVASVQIFAYLRSPLTYPLLYLAGDMRRMQSSIGSFVSLPVAVAILAAPLLYLAAVRASAARSRPGPTRARRIARTAGALALLAVIWSARQAAAGRWSDRDDHLIARSPHWEIVASSVVELLGGRAETFNEPFPAEYLEDFEARPAPAAGQAAAAPPGRPFRNAILLVLETTPARYMSLYGSKYDTTPNLVEESAHAIVFDNFYCHVGQTANSVASIALSIYPYMTWREYTVEYPDLPGKTLADVLRPRGFRTAVIHSGDLEYTGQARFLRGRGFDDLLDYRHLGGKLLTSWGSEDRVLVDGALQWIDKEREKPFFILAWTIQAHHPYEPSPGHVTIDFFKGDLPPDDYDLGRYLNTLHEVDGQIGRLFDGLRQRGLAENTVVVIVGDHGEAFGDPHPTWGHGARLWEENVRVPFMVWSPTRYPVGRRSGTIGGHVDLNPTLADLLGVPPDPSWQGRSVFAETRPPRAYFYAANDDYLLGVRDGNWKYVYNATRGKDELYDLIRDPDEQSNVAAQNPEVCSRLRQRLAAWRDHAGRHLARLRGRAS